MYQIRLRCICEHFTVVLWDYLGGHTWWLIRRQSEDVEHANGTFHSLGVVISGLDELQPSYQLFLTGNVHNFCGLLCPHSRRNLPPLYRH
jgi:hypothetical protein